MSDPPTLNVDGGAASYREFISTLRQIAAEPGRVSNNRPVLPPQERVPTVWLDVVLQTGDDDQRRRLRVRIRRDNLYVVGFRDEDGDTWYEFNERPDSPHLIPGSTCE